MARKHVVGVVLWLGACHSAPQEAEPLDASPDAFSPDAYSPSCWFESPREPRGSATLGKGTSTFEDLGDEVALTYGVSADWLVALNVRTTGLPAGNPMNILDPTNPFTRIRAFFADTGLPLNELAECGSRLPYEPGLSGSLELPFPMTVIFDSCWDASHLIGRRVRLELEVLAADGGYASEVRTVTLTAPPEGSYPIEEGAPGCEAR